MNLARILKIELLVLAALSGLAIPAYVLGDYWPDNFLTISSVSSSINFFSYYFSSFFAFISYSLGIWVLFPSIIFLLCYSFIYRKREFFTDTLNILSLLFVSLALFFLFFPKLIGPGLFFLLEKEFSFWLIFFLTPVFLFLFFWGTFRENFICFLRENALKLWALLKKDKVQEEIQTEEEQKPAIKEPPSEEKALPVAPSIEEKVEKIPLPITEAEKIIPAKPLKKKTEDNEYFEIVTAFTKSKKPQQSVAPKNDYYEQIAQAIQEKLSEFNVHAKIVNVQKGPIVDTFELELGPGIKISRVEDLEDDLGLALQGVNVRIIPQMRGRSTMGIEVPRNIKEREIIYLDQILNSQEFQKTQANLPLVLGRDVFGRPSVSDLAGLPHLLVAGTTGSGKSVFLNAVLVSLLVKKSPSQMKLILIDPKRVELAMFSKLPHLLMPTITDHRKASAAFLWAIEEMERRYQIMLEAQVKNISAFNERLEERRKDQNFIDSIRKHYPEDRADWHLPYIVIVIDEFANLMTSNSAKDIEQSISTLAAKARASGIHIILATQRPSVDVVSGIVKTNFPTRVAFRVASPQDSKTILNLGGAEKLLGRGDMLFLKDADTLRMHSAYIADDEIEATTDELSKLEGEYDSSALEMLEKEGQEAGRISGAVGTDEEDEFYPKALELVLAARTASATMLQRRLGIGYPRAGKLIDMLEANGVIGPADGAKPRKVLVSSVGDDDLGH